MYINPIDKKSRERDEKKRSKEERSRDRDDDKKKKKERSRDRDRAAKKKRTRARRTSDRVVACVDLAVVAVPAIVTGTVDFSFSGQTDRRGAGAVWLTLNFISRRLSAVSRFRSLPSVPSRTRPT